MTPQIPLGSGFGPRTTARDVLGDRRLDGLRVVITGGSAGVGLEDRGGVYCEDCDIAIAVPADHPEPRGVRPWARDPAVAERLWRARKEWTSAARVMTFLPRSPQRWPPSHSAVPTSLTASPRPLRAFTRRRQANPSPSGRRVSRQSTPTTPLGARCNFRVGTVREMLWFGPPAPAGRQCALDLASRRCCLRSRLAGQERAELVMAAEDRRIRLLAHPCDRGAFPRGVRRRARPQMRALALAAALWSAGGAAWADMGAILPPSHAWVTISTEELRARYDTLWAISDVHGRLGELEQLLVASGLCVNQAGRIAWNRERSRQILLVVGDLLNGGKESVGVVLLLEGLQPEAAAAGSRLVVLMGNHEVEFLANPALASRDLLRSAWRAGRPRRDW